MNKPSCYIQFHPEIFQQVAPKEKYRAKEKLIYKFISKNLIFAYDNCKRLTLNSANILIPEIPHYPIKVIAALFNSSLYQFLFQKKFSSIKVLRSHIEEMPLPLWNKNTFYKIINLVDKAIQNQNNFQELDDYIINKFLLSEKEKNLYQWDEKIVMEFLKKHLEKLIQTLSSQHRHKLKSRLDDLISMYPFNEYEYIISSLLALGKITLDGYLEIRDEYICSKYVSLYL